MANTEPSERAKEIIGVADRLFSERLSTATLWQEIAEHFYVERADFTNLRSPGQEFADHLMTSYPMMMRRDLGNAFQAILRPNTPWFNITTGRDEIDQDDAVAAWIDRAESTLRRAIYDRKAQFDRATKQGDHDFATFGNAVMTVEEHPSGVGLLFRAWHLRDTAWAENEIGEIDTVARRVKLSARSLVQKFRDNVAPAVKTAMQKSPYTMFDCYAIVVPTELWEYRAPEGKETPTQRRARQTQFPWMTIYLDRSNNHILKEQPIKRNPYVIPRWQLTSQSVYAYSPATICGLPDARLLQRMTLSMLEASEKAVDPPLLARGEALRGGVQLFAGGLTYVDPEYDDRMGRAVDPLFETQTFEPAKDFYERQMMLMRDMFYVSKLNMPDTREMTAYETSVRVKEWVREVLPLFGPVQYDYNGKLLDLSLQICLDHDTFGPKEDIPQQLQNRDVDFSYVNPLQAALDEMKANTLQTGMALVQGMMAVDPAIPANVNARAATRDALRGLQWPETWLATEDEVDAAEAKSNQQAQIGNAMDLANQGAATATNVAGAAQAVQAAGAA